MPFTPSEPGISAIEIMITRGNASATNRLILTLYRNRSILLAGRVFRNSSRSEIAYTLAFDWQITETGKVELPDGTIYARSDHLEYQGQDTIVSGTELPTNTIFEGPLEPDEDIPITEGIPIGTKYVHNTKIPDYTTENWMYFDFKVGGITPGEVLVLNCKEWVYNAGSGYPRDYISFHTMISDETALTEITPHQPPYVTGWEKLISANLNYSQPLTVVETEGELTTDPDAPYTIYLSDSLHFKLGVDLVVDDVINWYGLANSPTGLLSFGSNPGVLYAHKNSAGDYLLGYYPTAFRRQYGVINESTFRFDIFSMNKLKGSEPDDEKFIPAERIISEIIRVIRKGLMLGMRGYDGASVFNIRGTDYRRIWLRNDWMSIKSFEFDFVHPEIWSEDIPTIRTLSLEGLGEV
jgi:hypothetical protein